MSNVNVPFSANQHQLALLRLVNWGLKIGLILFATDLFGLTTPPIELTYVLLIEACYVGFSYRFHRLSVDNHGLLFTTLLLDSLFLAAWLYFTGGATNAFVSLLLLPIAISAVTLPRWAPWCLTVLSTAFYSVMIVSITAQNVDTSMTDDMSQLPMGHALAVNHSMDMGSHYLGMWFNFVISALVLTVTVGFIAKRIRQKNAELRYLREAQLRQEKILALGTASAQMAHQLATPLATLRLLLDELVDLNIEDGTIKTASENITILSKVPISISTEPADIAATEQNVLIAEMQQALNRCEITLVDLRVATESIREQKTTEQALGTLAALITEQVNLLMPETQLSLTVDPLAWSSIIATDMSLLPALLALIQNGAQASETNQQPSRVDINIMLSQSKSQHINIVIRDYGAGIATHLLQTLGHNMVESRKGMGISILLSHTSFERLGGELCLRQHADGGTEAIVSLPNRTSKPLLTKT